MYFCLLAITPNNLLNAGIGQSEYDSLAYITLLDQPQQSSESRTQSLESVDTSYMVPYIVPIIYEESTPDNHRLDSGIMDAIFPENVGSQSYCACLKLERK